MTTTHAISLHAGGGGGGGGGGGSSGGSSGSGSSGTGNEAPSIEWFTPLTMIAAVEETGAEVILHLRDGGARVVPCAGGERERHACYTMVQEVLRTL